MAKIHADLDLRFPVSWRVHFAYDGDNIRAVAAEKLRMIAPGGAEVPFAEQRHRSGAYVEVYAHGDPDARWSRVIAQPNRADREVFLEEGGITRIAAPAKGEFDLVIPDLGSNATFALYTSPVDAPEKEADLRVSLSLAEMNELGPRRSFDEDRDW